MASHETIPSHLIRFGQEFELDIDAYELRRAGEPIKLGRIPMELLLLLIEQRAQLVTRDQIVERVWGKAVFLDTDNGINAAIRKIRQVLDDAPEQPRFVQTIVGRGYRFIAKIEEGSLEKAGDSSLELGIDLSQVRSRPTWVFRSRGIAIPLAVGALALMTLVLIANMSKVRKLLDREAQSQGEAQLQARPSIAVLGFRNLSQKPEQDWISTALSEMLSADLAVGHQLRLIPGENVARMKMDLSLPSEESYGTATLAKIRSQLSSDMVVLGSYLAVAQNPGEKIHVTLQVQDARTGEIICAISEDGNEADLPRLVAQSGDNLRQNLHVTGISQNQATQVRSALPENSIALRYYSEGLAKLRSLDIVAAREMLLHATAEDPNHALSHAALSEAWSSLGYDLKAQEEAKKAFALSSSLPREDQLSVEGRYRIAIHDWTRAVEIYQMLWGFFPDNVEYGLELARAQTSAGLGKDAMATVRALSKAPLRARGDPRIDLAEAAAADLVGDFRREEAAARRAAESAARQGERMMNARALQVRGGVLSALGDSGSAIGLLQQAQTVFAEVGDKREVVRVLSELSIIARHQSNLDQASALATESLRIAREIGSKVGMQQALINVGNVMWERGDIRRTREVYEESLSLAREVGDRQRQAVVLNNLAGLLALQGSLAKAREMNDEALRLSNEVGDQEGTGMLLGNVACLLTEQGDLAQAKKTAEVALATDRQVGNKSSEGDALFQLASVLVAQGDVVHARSKHQESAALRHSLGEKVPEAESQLALAQLHLEDGDARAAESEARKLAATFHQESSPDDESLSYSLMASALFAQGRIVEAAQAAATAKKILPKVLDVSNRLQVEIEVGHTEALLQLANSPASARPSKLSAVARPLESARQQAKHLGYVGLELEAGWRLADLELKSGSVISARFRLAQLNTEAQAKGFLLIARKASAALHQS